VTENNQGNGIPVPTPVPMHVSPAGNAVSFQNTIVTVYEAPCDYDALFLPFNIRATRGFVLVGIK